ncbi:hypothetical protein AB0F93_03520 [Micromonospora tulbaghiae]|uniref:hypothetical protein n=1 Tax=Micromonospora tulbaghiae TaxID=479978 RepID=UPI003332A8B0
MSNPSDPASATVRIRIESTDPAALDDHEKALRAVLTVPAPASVDYPNRRDPGRRRFLESTGVRAPQQHDAGWPPSADAAAYVAASAPLAVAEDAKHRRDLAGEVDVLIAADRDLRRQPWFPLRPGDVVLSWLPPVAHAPAYGQTYVAVDDGATDLADSAMLREVSTTDLPPAGVQLPDWSLAYHQGSGHWELHALDDEGTGLAPWETADHLIRPSQDAEAKAWAAEQIAEAEGEGPTGWKLWNGQSTAVGTLINAEFAGELVPTFGDNVAAVGPQLTSFYSLWFEAGPAALTIIRAGAVVHGTPARTEAVR